MWGGDGHGDLVAARGPESVGAEANVPKDRRPARCSVAPHIAFDDQSRSCSRAPAPPSRYRVPRNAVTSSRVFRFRYQGARPRS
jgi:hypothetical protein